MEKPEDRILCFNEICLASNPQKEQFCYQCGLPLIKRYLWSVNHSKITFSAGELVANRFLCKSPNVFLDTKPGAPPVETEILPRTIQPYLKLSGLSLNIPRVFGKLLEEEEIWLLEYGTVPVDQAGEAKYPELLPSLSELWGEASNLQQLNWLLQMVKLWEPLKSQGVLSTLFQENLLKINSSFLQLQQLQPDELEIHKIKDLSTLWRKWLPETSPSLKGFLEGVCQKLERGEIEEARDLLIILDQAIKSCQNFYEWSYTLYTQTDTGPSREHNEDYCYPENRSTITSKTTSEIIAIVCDGIGGQDAGEVASQLATQSLLEAITATLDQQEGNDTYHIIRKAILKTNDLICERNDQEQRSERQRMGTTLVMAVVKDNEIYISNLGDSRAYWITQDSCHQITVDDDIASRDVKLGYYLYRDAIQHINSGALTQALGTATSSNLYPSIQRHIPEKDSIILLTSDGLSDYDLIEQHWRTELLPLLEGQKSITQVGESLINLANEKNGHDNSTIALIYCQIKARNNTQNLVISLPENNLSTDASSQETNLNEHLTKILVFETDQPKKKTPKTIIAILSLAVTAALGYFGYTAFLSNNNNPAIPTPVETVTPAN